MKVLVTGSRECRDAKLVSQQLTGVYQSGLIVIHGDAQGADLLAHQWCEGRPGVYEIRIPAKWSLLGKGAGAARNRAMLELNPDLVLAFYKKGAGNRGTGDMVFLAGSAGIPTEVFWEE